MTESLRAMLQGAIDYAGLFPPAALTLQQAIDAHLGCLEGTSAWIVSRFICPAQKLDELGSILAEAHPAGMPPWQLSVTGKSGDTLNAFLDALCADMRYVAGFAERSAPFAVVEMYEVKVPLSVIQAGRDAVLELLERSAEAAATAGVEHVIHCLEIPPSQPDPTAVALQAIKWFNDQWGSEKRYHQAQVKIRTGGLAREAFPSTRQLAFFIRACRELGLKFKATAGLHHPLPQGHGSLKVNMHGFLNLFAAACLAHTESLELPVLVQILECDRVEDFSFERDKMAWRDHSVRVTQIRATRQQLCTSFGSCSVEEPLEGLSRLGLL